MSRSNPKWLVEQLDALAVTAQQTTGTRDKDAFVLQGYCAALDAVQAIIHASAPASARSWDDIKEREKLLDYMRVPLEWRNPARDAFDRHVAAVRKAADSDRAKMERLIEAMAEAICGFCKGTRAKAWLKDGKWVHYDNGLTDCEAHEIRVAAAAFEASAARKEQADG